MARHSSLCLAVLAATLWLPAAPAAADILVIDDTTGGTVFDGILDGFPFPPPGVPKDGNPDFLGNALAVALQTGVTEERGIAELPLASLAGLTAADIQSATLTFNIDDVIGTFGPGTTFDGTAAATIVLFGYSGNGTVDLADFNNVVGAPLSVVDTTPLGVITDATLAISGPLVFDIDVTVALETLIGGGATHFGVVFTTSDAGSATSIDNLGPSGAGPAGVAGAAMPFLTVVTGAGDPPVFTPAALTCQKGIAKASQKFVSAKQKALGKCFGSVLADAVTGDGFAKSTDKCASGLDVGDPKSKLSKAIAKLQATIADQCTGVLPAQINSPCNPSAPDMAAIASCLLAHHGAQVEASLAAEYGEACALITAVGLDAALPGLCAAP